MCMTILYIFYIIIYDLVDREDEDHTVQNAD